MLPALGEAGHQSEQQIIKGHSRHSGPGPEAHFKCIDDADCIAAEVAGVGFKEAPEQQFLTRTGALGRTHGISSFTWWIWIQ